MTRSKRRRKKDNKAAVKAGLGPHGPTQAKDKPVKRRRSRVRSCLKAAGWLAWNGLALVAAIVGLWIAVWPHVYVRPSVCLDPNNPTFTYFVVHNQGYLPIRRVKFSGAINELQLPDGTRVIAAVPFANRFAIPAQVSHVIGPGEEASELLPFSGFEHNQFVYADIAVRLEYKPLIWVPFCEKEELHRFVLVKAKDGQWHWLPQPLNKHKQATVGEKEKATEKGTRINMAN